MISACCLSTAMGWRRHLTLAFLACVLLTGCTQPGPSEQPQEGVHESGQPLEVTAGENATAQNVTLTRLRVPWAMDSYVEHPFLVPPGRLEVEVWINATAAGPYALFSAGGVSVGVDVAFVDASGKEMSLNFGYEPEAGAATGPQRISRIQDDVMHLTVGNGTITLLGHGTNVHTELVLRSYVD
jgi:hypothetical protein